jgi:hypothetical protein
MEFIENTRHDAKEKRIDPKKNGHGGDLVVAEMRVIQ